MTPDKEKYIQERYAEYEKKWTENPPPPHAPIVDTEREKDKDKWLIDETAAEVVRYIFRLCESGKGPLQIAK